MGDEVHLWQVGEGDELAEIQPGHLDFEDRIEKWLKRDISILEPALLVIGNQVETDGGPIDLLCIDAAGDLVVVELKRDKTPRLITAQVLDYASCVASFSHDEVTEIASKYLGRDLEDAFREEFELELPETLNADHRMLVVGSEIDPSSERIIKYLSDEHGVDINAATFRYFRQPDGSELLAGVFLIEPSEVERSVRAKGGSKRRPNLTYEELQAQADEAGGDVRELYDYAVDAFERLLRKGRTKSSIAFTGNFNGSNKTVLSFLPGDSNEEGLFYRLYKNRFAELAGLAPAEFEALVPQRHQHWSFDPTGKDPDWAGFEGVIVGQDEVDRLAGALRRTASAGESMDTPSPPAAP